ncbi:EI24 domain-containing protein [Naasia sp. SYSU D00057]|uniref:EI24 domain-containing protein n=1 Tax=Naasia sp. SYSU D00057 TaxID=2817380 RepID=UPI001B307E9A|nr:EI24 domain-containing protein [Naasia sp. SYSU D00057]
MELPRTAHRQRGLPAFAGGVGTLFRGFRLWGSSPGLMALGALPALVVGVVVLTAIVLLAVNLDGLAAWITPFADRWDEVWRTAVRFAAALALLILAILLAVSTFTALTLAVGDPFYERIWLAVEQRLGGFRQADTLGFWGSVRRGVASGLKLVTLSALLGLGVFLLGLIPIAGGVLAFCVGALGGGWLVAAELLGRPFDGREVPPAVQRRLRRQNRARVLGFGVAVYLMFLLPFVAVLATPAAVAGATVLARRLLGEDSDQAEVGDRLGRRLPHPSAD